jgi:hypothetical protein
MASFTSSLATTKTTLHESGRSWVSYITQEMRWMELTACRSLSVCLHAYDICFCVHFDFVLFDCPQGSSCGTYRGPLVLVSMISMITIVAYHTHVCSLGHFTLVMPLLESYIALRGQGTRSSYWPSDAERVRTRYSRFLGCRRRCLHSGRVPARALGRCRRYRRERRMLHLRCRIPRSRHSLTFRHLPLSSLSAVSPTIQHRPRPSHSSTCSVLLQGLRHQRPSLTLGLHPCRLH